MTLILLLSCTPSSGSLSLPEGTYETDTDTGTGVAPTPDTSVWIGERDISYDGCNDTLVEDGFQLDEDWEYYEYVQDECSKCTHFYEVDVSPDEACGLAISTTVYRGLILDAEEGSAEVWGFSNRDTTEYDYRAEFDGTNVDYEYDLYDGYVEIVGRINFPELEE